MKTLNFLLIAILLTAGNFLCYAQSDFKNMVNRYLDHYYETTSPVKVYVHLDKYLYEKGENVWITAIAANRFTQQLVTGAEDITIKLFNDKGSEILGKSLRLENGVAKGTIPLMDYVNAGNYTLKAFHKSSQEALYRRNFAVKDHAIPYHLVNARFQDKFYKAGEEINIHIAATDYFKEPLRRANYEYHVMTGSQHILSGKGKLDKSGAAVVTFSIPGAAADDGLAFNLTVEENKVLENITVPIPVQSENVKVFFYPEGGSLVAELTNKLAIKAYGAEGGDFPFAGSILNENGEKLGEVQSDESGKATFSFLPHEGQTLTLQITSPYPLSKVFHLPQPLPAGATLSLSSIGDGNVNLKVRHFPEQERIYYLGIIHKGNMYEAQKINLKSETQLDFSSLRPGINKFTLFNPRMEPVSEVLVYAPQSAETSIEAAFTADTYKNREKVTLNLNGNVPLYYAFSAVDEYRLQPPESRSTLLSHFNIDTELAGDIVINPKYLAQPRALSQKINELLPYTYAIDSWKDIYGSNNKIIGFQGERKTPPLRQQNTAAILKDGNIHHSNFTEEVYYLANNPVLIEKLNEQKKVKKSDPLYKQQLRNGVALRDVIKNMKQYDVIGDKIVFLGARNSLNYQGGALIVLDGIKLGESIGILNQINPYDIEEIFISTNAGDIHRYTGLNSVGIIEIKTKRGISPENEDAADYDKEFQSPDYSKNENTEDDLRTTIFYAPFGEAAAFPENITFYHSDIRTNVIGRIEGLDEHGNAFYREVSYSSFNYSEENQ